MGLFSKYSVAEQNKKENAQYEPERYDEALKAFDRAIDIDPDEGYAWYNKGSALKNLQIYEKAQACCDKAPELAPTNSISQKLKAEISEKILEGDILEIATLKDKEI